MNIIRIRKLERGFILYITLIMLIIFAIIGVSLYQQTSIGLTTVQYVTFKQEAEDLALAAINVLEKKTQEGDSRTWPKCKALTAAEKLDKTKVANHAFLCNPVPSDMVSEAIGNLNAGGLPDSFQPVGGDSSQSWVGLESTDVDSFSQNGTVYYIVQDLGDDPQSIGYYLYRITVLAGVLDSYSVMDAIYAKPTTVADGDDDYWW